MKTIFKKILFVFVFFSEANGKEDLNVDGKSYFSVEYMMGVAGDQFTSKERRDSILKYIKETPGLWPRATNEFWTGLTSVEGCSPSTVLRAILLCKDVPEAEWNRIFDEVVHQAYLPETERLRLWPYLMEGGLLAMTERRDPRTEDLAIQLHKSLKSEKDSIIYSHQIRPALEKMGGPKAVEYLDARFQKWVDETIPNSSRSVDLKMDPIAATIRRRLRDEGKVVPAFGVLAEAPKSTSSNNPIAFNQFRWMPWLLAGASGFGLSWLLRRYLQFRH